MKTAAAEYVEISREDMEKFIQRSFHSMKPKSINFKGELAYILKVNPTEKDSAVGIKILTSMGFNRNQAAKIGEDAIRVQLVSLIDDGPLKGGKAPIVKRVGGWKDNLKKQVHNAIEVYYGEEKSLENWASTRGKGPAKIEPRHEHMDETIVDPEINDVVERIEAPAADATLVFRPGHTTEKQFKFIKSMMAHPRSEQGWRQMFDARPTPQQVAALPMRDASRLIDGLKNATGIGGGGYNRRYAEELEDNAKWKI